MSSFDRFSHWLRSELFSSLQSLKTVLLPPCCGVCRTALPQSPSYGLCAHCQELLLFNQGPSCPICALPGMTSEPCVRCQEKPLPISRLVAPFLYGGVLADAWSAVKFHQREGLAKALGRHLASFPGVREAALCATCLVPVPLGRRRGRQRGFNQSALLARELSHHWQIPVSYALRRIVETQKQSDLSLLGRQANVSGVFVPRKNVRGKCLLVDDIVTSGETIRHAARALWVAGAEDVVVIALARTENLLDSV